MIKPVSFENVDNRYNLKSVKKNTNANSFQGESLSLSNSQVGRAILNRNNISFRNLLEPIEVTDKYNKPIAGKDHLDLPNIHVYEFPDTNLQAIVNVDKDSIGTKPQYQFAMQLNKVEYYDILKQVLVNKILFQKIKTNHIDKDNLYIPTPPNATPSQYFSTSMDSNFNIENISKINSIVSSNNFTNESLEEAKEEVISSLSSEEYDEETKLAKELYKDILYSKDDVIKLLNSITLNDIKDYYKKILENSNIQTVLTISEDDFKNNKDKLLKLLNSNLNQKFLKYDKKEYLDNKLNDKVKFIYKNADKFGIKTNYFYNAESYKDVVIFKILSKLFLKYSENEQKLLEDKIDELSKLYKYNDIKELNSYKNILRDRKIHSEFVPTHNEVINEPLEYGGIFTKSGELYSTYYSIQNTGTENIKKINIQNILQNDKKVFEAIINSDINKDLEEIKNDYKTFIKSAITQDYFTSLKNLYTADFGLNLFSIYETIDSISQDDIKNIVTKFFINQPPIIEIDIPKNEYENINKDA